MKSDTMSMVGVVLITLGSFLVVITGVFFYNYIQQILAAGASSGSSSSTSIIDALNIYNGTSNMPVFITSSIFGAVFLVMGAVFIAGAHISDNLLGRNMSAPRVAPQSFATPMSPTKACTKCGSLLYQSSAYCPNCGNLLGQTQGGPPRPV